MHYNKPKSIILSAEFIRKPLETIEVSLETLEIAPCLGKHNQNREYHDRILEIIRANMYQLTKRIS